MAEGTILNPQQVETRNIVVVGRAGCGKSTVGNQILGVSNGGFEVKATPSSVTLEPLKRSSLLKYEGTTYMFNVLDTVGLFDTGKLTNKEIMKKTKEAIKQYVDGIHLVVFVIKEGRFTQDEETTFKIVHDHFSADIDPISLIVITNCESKKRDDIIRGYKENEKTKKIMAHAKKGVIAVGYPNLDDLDDDLAAFFEERIKKDALKLREVAIKSREIHLQEQLYSDSWCVIL